MKYIIATFIMLVFTVSLASAYFPSTREVSQGIIDTYVDLFEPILQALLGGNDWTGFLLFEKLLIYVILVALIFAVLKKTPFFSGSPKWVLWVITIVVPLLGVRFIDYEWLWTIIFQYQILAIVFTAILPFILYFFFLHSVADEHPSIRKVGWIFFIIVYLGLWSTSDYSEHSDIYFWTMIAALVFLFADGTIHRYYLKQRIKEGGSDNIMMHIVSLQKKQEEINNSSLNQKTKKRLLDKLDKEIKDWEKRAEKYL